jgi:hypothetical protein
MGLHPLFERSEIAAREKFGEAGAESLSVVAQIVAALQCDGPSARSTPRFEDRSENAVNGRTPTVEIGHDVRVRDVEFVVIVEVVPAFGDREGDDSTRARRTAFDQRRMIRRPRQHLLNGTDGLVLPYTIR